MAIKEFIEKILEGNCGNKKYLYSKGTNEVYTFKKSGEVNKDPMTIVYQYYNTYRKVTYIAWIEDVKAKDKTSQLLLSLGKTDSDNTIREMELIELLTDEYEKLNFITKLVAKTK